MMRADANVAVFVCVTPVDMRKQAATLALIVKQTLKRNMFEPALWVFSNERRDRIKIVYWQRNGLCLWSKRLEGRDQSHRQAIAAGYTFSDCNISLAYCRHAAMSSCVIPG
jgi:hypothetical protein